MTSITHSLSSAKIVDAAMTRMQSLIQECDDKTTVALRSSDRRLAMSDASLAKHGWRIGNCRQIVETAHAASRR